MMMITRTHTTLEFGLGGTRNVSVDVAGISGALLTAERLPCGRISHALLLMTRSGVDPIRIEGEPLELAEAHCYIVDIMLDGETEGVPAHALH